MLETPFTSQVIEDIDANCPYYILFLLNPTPSPSGLNIFPEGVRDKFFTKGITFPYCECFLMAKIDVIKEFREDHGKVRDGLLDLSDALQKHDVTKARQILNNINTLVGPHFRYEEEALYPSLRQFLGEYVDQLLKEHENVINTAKSAAQLLGKDTLTEEEAANAVKAARSLLVHVSNCDGLGILTERLSVKELKTLGEKLSQARKSGVPLLEWADKIRKK